MQIARDAFGCDETENIKVEERAIICRASAEAGAIVFFAMFLASVIASLVPGSAELFLFLTIVFAAVAKFVNFQKMVRRWS